MADFNLYPSTSPYYLSSVYDEKFLDVMINRNIPMNPSDVYYVPAVYEYRPDMLAYDLYTDPKLWWVFLKDPNKLKDPLFNFVAG